MDNAGTSFLISHKLFVCHLWGFALADPRGVMRDSSIALVKSGVGNQDCKGAVRRRTFLRSVLWQLFALEGGDCVMTKKELESQKQELEIRQKNAAGDLERAEQALGKLFFQIYRKLSSEERKKSDEIYCTDDGDAQELENLLTRLQMANDAVQQVREKISELNEIRVCIKCGTPLEDDIDFCPECGQRIYWDENVCPQCGNPRTDGAVFCMSCGYKFKTEGYDAMNETVRRCKNCSTILEDAAVFCPNCGTKQ